MIRVYAGPCCKGSDRSRALVEWVLDERPDVDIRLIEVSEAREMPDSLFAVPTWYVNEEIWKLGNPSDEELLSAVERDRNSHAGQETNRLRSGIE